MRLSESARATTAAEARFRVDYPNSQRRSIKVVALDAASERVLKQVARGAWPNASFLTATASVGADPGWTVTEWLNDLAGHAKSLVAEIESADLVVMILAVGGNPQAAS